MKIWNEIQNQIWQAPSVVMIGKFDGMHRGHKVIEDRVLKIANEQGLSSIVISFDMSISNAICSNNANTNKTSDSQELMTLNEKIAYFQNSGFDLFINCPFDDYLRTMSREDFLKEILLKNLNVKHIVVGEDFYFGYQAAGNATFLKENEQLGYKADVIKPLKYIDGIINDSDELTGTVVDDSKKRLRITTQDMLDDKVSSSRIRECINSHDIESANIMLGYKYSFTGNVIHGNHIGSTLDLPTINLQLDKAKMLPPFGVYTGKCIAGDNIYNGIINIGVKPTVGEYEPNIEMHLIDFNGDLYDQSVKIEIDKFVRLERKFDNLTQLKNQILDDIKQI